MAASGVSNRAPTGLAALNSKVTLVAVLSAAVLLLVAVVTAFQHHT